MGKVEFFPDPCDSVPNSEGTKESRTRVSERSFLYIPYKTFLWRTNLRRPKFWRSENMAKLNKNRQISDVTENKGIFHHFL